MQLKQKLTYVAIGAMLAFAVQALPDLGDAEAQAAVDSPTIKYVLTVDYPLGGKADYLNWVKSVAADLQSPDEVKRVTFYDNYYGASPNRFIELEFDNIEAATSYFNTDQLRTIMGEWSSYGINTQVHVLVQRSDYTKN